MGALVKIGRFSTATDAQVAAAKLESSGIAAQVLEDSSRFVGGARGRAEGGSTLLVNGSDAERAMKIVGIDPPDDAVTGALAVFADPDRLRVWLVAIGASVVIAIVVVVALLVLQ